MGIHPVLYLAVTVVEVSGLGVDVGVVDILDGLSVLVVELAGEGEAVEELPLKAGVRDDVRALSGVLGQFLQGHGVVVVAGAV